MREYNVATRDYRTFLTDRVDHCQQGEHNCADFNPVNFDRVQIEGDRKAID